MQTAPLCGAEEVGSVPDAPRYGGGGSDAQGAKGSREGGEHTTLVRHWFR